MKRMFLIFSHKMTELQVLDAKKSFGIRGFVYLNEELQRVWSSVPPDMVDIKEYLEPIVKFLKESLKDGDVALVQGDFGATCYIANRVKELGGVAVYATTKREVVEIKVGDKIEKKSLFMHVMFRKYF